MEYKLPFEGGPSTVPGGTALLLLHPSTGETDRIDTEFLREDHDRFLVVSTRTTAREVRQKLEHYDVDESRAVIVDALSVERGYSRRRADNIHYVSAPDDVDGILTQVERFLADTTGKRRISIDSITELAYYADADRAETALHRLAALLEDYDAIGLFHVDREVHDAATIDRFRAAVDGVIALSPDDELSVSF